MNATIDYKNGMFSNSNRTYLIDSVIDFKGATVFVGENTVFVFNNRGGFINGTLVGNASTIDAKPVQIFSINFTLSGYWTNSKLIPQWYGAIGNNKIDCTDAIQKTIDVCYNINKKCYIPSGKYIITRSLFVYDGINLEGDGIYNTILKTPFGKSIQAKAYVDSSKGGKNTITDYHYQPFIDIDYSIGHNRFYIGDGNVGYYDSDRDTNPNHPLYWPDDGSDEWDKWITERATIQNQGRFVGKTGREGYGGGLIKCSQTPNIYYPSKGETGYNPQRPGGHVHSGVRNVTIYNLQINTNSSDRGKDSAINFKYKANTIPSAIRETYDSSVLNCKFESLYLFSIGKDALSGYRAVDWIVANVYMRQCAENGLNIEGVTSVFVTGCYANSCIINGYKFKGVNYSTLASCAADSCGVGYNLNKCLGLALDSCGAEAFKFQPVSDESEEEVELHGRGFQIVNCKGVTVNSPYTMASHFKDPDQTSLSVEEGDETFDSDYLQSRHVFISNSQDISINNPYFKSFQRIRTAPYRDANNNKCDYQGGTYNPTTYGSKYWQVQNYLVGAQYEVKGESSTHKITIVASRTEEELAKESEIRTENIDILDPGIVENPLLADGYSTAGKTISGRDGNGGWTYLENGVTKKLSLSNFEFVFPINGTTIDKARNYFWAWRNSLILVRVKADDQLLGDLTSEYGSSVAARFINKVSGYLDILNEGEEYSDSDHVTWSEVSSTDLDKFKVDILDGTSYSKLIDGDDKYYGIGKLFHEDLSVPTYKPKIFTPIPGHVRTNVIGCRTILNNNNYKNLPSVFSKAALGIVGNKDRLEESESVNPSIIPTSELVAGDILSLLNLNSINSEVARNLFGIYKLDGSKIFGISDENRGFIEHRGHKILSVKDSDITNISKLSNSAVLADVIAKVNSILDRLEVQGLMEEASEPSEDITFSILNTTSGDTSLVISYKIISEQTIYDVGAAYSGTNTNPTTNQNSVYAENQSSSGNEYTGTLTIPRNNSSNIRYIKMFVELAATHGSSTREYDTKVYLWSGNNVTEYTG